MAIPIWKISQRNRERQTARHAWLVTKPEETGERLTGVDNQKKVDASRGATAWVYRVIRIKEKIVFWGRTSSVMSIPSEQRRLW